MRKHAGGRNLGEDLIPAQASLKHAGRHGHPEDTIVTINDIPVGGQEIVVMAGPCSVESEDQLISTARSVKASGARILRGGAFKPRTSPYSFQGLKEDGLKLLAVARQETGLSLFPKSTGVPHRAHRPGPSSSSSTMFLRAVHLS